MNLTRTLPHFGKKGAFPFPTAPDQGQIKAALKLLCAIGCIDNSRVDVLGGDGCITCLGRSVSRLPLGVRYGKMLLMGAQANVLDYAIALVAVLSEVSPFLCVSEEENTNGDSDELSGGDSDLDSVDQHGMQSHEAKSKLEQMHQWMHPDGDVLAALHAVGAYTYAGHGAGKASEIAACKKFCCENGLNFVVLQRIQKLRRQLARLVKLRLGGYAQGVAAKTGGILHNTPPPSRLQENLLRQVGMLGNSFYVILQRLYPDSRGLLVSVFFLIFSRFWLVCLTTLHD